jgi:putative nucleotidyltransferase with HDIG domain
MQEPHIDDSRSVPQKKRWQDLLGGNHTPQRLILALGFLIILTCFLQFREVRLEVVEIGTSAPRYVIAQTDFSFWDEEATQTLKQEAVRDIGAIYKVNEDEVQNFRRSFENSLIERQQWREVLPGSTFEEVYTLLDKIEEELSEARFTDRRSLNKMKMLKIPTSHFILFQLPLSQTQPLILPQSLWSEIQQNLATQKQFQSETADYLLDAFSQHPWLVERDFPLERDVRIEVQSEIPDRYTHVYAGSQIIKKGEKIAARHIAMVQAMKNALNEARNLWSPWTLLGSALVALCLTVVALLYLYYFHRELMRSMQKMVLLVTIIVMSFILAKCTEFLLLNESKNLIEMARFPLLIPFAALLICVLIGAEIAIVTSLFLLLIFAVTLAVDTVPFLLTNFFAAVVTILFARKLHKRKEVFAVCGKVWVSVVPLIIGLNLIDNSLKNFNFATDLLSSFIFLVVTAILVVGLLPILESIFHVMTDMTLMEYMDPDHELLRRLSLEAPGTYQHCLVVGNIAEAAARAIGANGLFCRVSTLYHDIGKLFNPHYFTENQLGGFNIHLLLTPAESTHVIIAHVPEGELLARKYHLPQSFVDIIREHHGTTMVYYFYCKQVEQMGGDATKVNEKAFRYPGPKPRSKESAIIMIADTVEAASRSMEEVTEEGMEEMIDKLVAEKAEDGQFDECQLTFEELGRVKRSLVKALIVTRHLRIKYPDRII